MKGFILPATQLDNAGIELGQILIDLGDVAAIAPRPSRGSTIYLKSQYTFKVAESVDLLLQEIMEAERVRYGSDEV